MKYLGDSFPPIRIKLDRKMFWHILQYTGSFQKVVNLDGPLSTKVKLIRSLTHLAQCIDAADLQEQAHKVEFLPKEKQAFQHWVFFLGRVYLL